jgi:DNA-binding NarL/FixJ family response regulator
MLEGMVAERLPRVVILGEAGDYDLLMRLKTSQPTMGVLVLVRDLTPLYGALLLVAGATCLGRAASVADIHAAVHLAAQGEPTLFCADGTRVVRRGPNEGLLTPREIEVFELLRLGWLYAGIGRALHIEPETVRTHTHSICRKLNVRSKQELRGMSPLSRLDRPL